MPINRISLFITGDFCPSNVPLNELQAGEASSFFGDLSEIISTADISITNLECPLTLSNAGIEKIGPNLKAHPSVASLLKTAGFDLITLANNHILDYGDQGLSDTLGALEQNGLAHVGAGMNIQAASKSYFVDLKGIKLAIVNFAENEFSSANSDHGGANPMNLIDNCHQIKEARANADHALVIIHGGHEQYNYPSPDTLKRYRFYAEAGASAVIAHHTHCIGGYEKHHGVPIFYSLGNFLFPMPDKMPQLWHEGYAVLFEITKGALEFQLLPYEQCSEGKFTISTKQSQRIFEKISIISSELSDDELVIKNWNKFIELRSPYYLSIVSGFGRYKTALLSKLGILKYFLNNEQLIHVSNLISCEAHKETISNAITNHINKYNKR